MIHSKILLSFSIGSDLKPCSGHTLQEMPILWSLSLFLFSSPTLLFSPHLRSDNSLIPPSPDYLRLQPPRVPASPGALAGGPVLCWPSLHEPLQSTAGCRTGAQGPDQLDFSCDRSPAAWSVGTGHQGTGQGVGQYTGHSTLYSGHCQHHW